MSAPDWELVKVTEAGPHIQITVFQVSGVMLGICTVNVP